MVLLWSCDHGLKPVDEPEIIKYTGLSGTIHYKNWPPQDSVLLLKLVVFKKYPPVNIVSEVLAGSAITYPEELAEGLPYQADSTEFEMQLEAGRYEYICVAQQYGNNIFMDWRVVGQYDITLQDTIPTAVTVAADSMVSGINIFVDFDSLPPQPF